MKTIIKTTMKKPLLIAVPLLAAILATSCVSPAVKSVHVNDDTDRKKPITGEAYSLPMVQLHLTAILTNVPDPNATNLYTYVPWVSNTSSATTVILQTNANAAVTITSNFSQSVTNFAVNTRLNTNRQAYLITVDPVISPDPNHLYALKFKDDKISSDVFGLNIDPTNNFIQSINASNSDQTIQIVTELAQAAATFATGLPTGLPAGLPNMGPMMLEPNSIMEFLENKKGATRRKHLPGRFEVYFDPTQDTDVQRANAEIAGFFYKDDVSHDTQALAECPIQLGVTFRNQPVSGATAAYLSTHPPCKTDGVLYRPLLPYVLQVKNKLGTTGKESSQYLVRSPNAAPVFALPVSRATFVTRTTALTFNNGFLQGVTYNNPSQAAAALGLPLTVAGAVVSSVTNVLQLKLNIATAQNQIATQQTAQVNQAAALNNATTNLLQSIQALSALKAKMATNTP